MKGVVRLRGVHIVLASMAVLVQVGLAGGQELNLLPRVDRVTNDSTFFSACWNMDQWSYVKQVTGYLGYWDQLYLASDGGLSSCAQNMNANGLQLSIETATLEPSWCQTGAS